MARRRSFGAGLLAQAPAAHYYSAIAERAASRTAPRDNGTGNFSSSIIESGKFSAVLVARLRLARNYWRNLPALLHAAAAEAPPPLQRTRRPWQAHRRSDVRIRA